ncbi:MAG: peptide-methionine (S)-S-oxide reductase MsrA [Prolixibacteraceae bacterium]|nr:peptide-methionine (S)-S-oxide reductase MsrA [Prolixibacteraceae bacterium]
MAKDVIVFGGGCFWCTDAVFERIEGVSGVIPGYSGGNVINPSYREVCTGNTGHAEVVEVTYNPDLVKLETILQVFFTTHDPTTLNRQGADVGTQYRSAIFYTNERQKRVAEQVIAELEQNNVFDDPIVTEVQPLENFYQAEEYHDGYFDANKQQPYCRFVIQPKIEKLENVFDEILKK